MTVSYVGSKAAKKSGLKKCFYHLAEMFYDDDNAKDTMLASRVFNLLRIKGWNVDDGVSGWGCVVVENRDEYDAFVKDYKESKRCIQRCMKFGF